MFKFLSFVVFTSLIATSAAAQASRSQRETDRAAVPDAARLARMDIDRRPESVTLSPADASRFAEPETGTVVAAAYNNKYFALWYSVPPDWTEGYKGPPPSDTGYYVLSSLKPGDTFKGPYKGTILIAAWDLFFVPRPAKNAMDLVEDMKETLPHVYTVEAPPTQVKIANHSFIRFDYTAAVAQLHWKVLATEIRCHMVEFVFTSRDTKLLDSLVQGLNTMKLPGGADVTSGTEGGEFPPCVKDYATGANVVHKVDPVMVGPRYTTIPVRFVIGTDGRVKYIHVINAFPEQARSVEDALVQWVFKPYIQNGAPAEVETGILFKFPPEDQKGKLP